MALRFQYNSHAGGGEANPVPSPVADRFRDTGRKPERGLVDEVTECRVVAPLPLPAQWLRRALKPPPRHGAGETRDFELVERLRADPRRAAATVPGTAGRRRWRPRLLDAGGVFRGADPGDQDRMDIWLGVDRNFRHRAGSPGRPAADAMVAGMAPKWVLDWRNIWPPPDARKTTPRP